MLHINEMLEKCEAEGVKVSRTYLYIAGQKHGFIKRNTDGSLELLREPFIKWIGKCKEKIPDGWLNIVQCAEKLGVSASQVYMITSANPSIVRRFGTKEVMYVQPDRVAEIIRQNKNVYGFKED